MRLPTVADIEKRLPTPEDFSSRARGTTLTSRVGVALGLCFGICFLTGLWSHVQYGPPSWIPLGPGPTQLYRITQGLHVITGTAAVPLLLVKLWSVFPRLLLRPDTSSLRGIVVSGLERLSIAALVGSGIFMLVSGLLNIAQWYPWNFSFRSTHYALAWIAIGSLLVHIAVKLPVIREALGVPIETADDDRDPDSIGRRTVLGGAALATGATVLLTAGQTVPFLRRVSVFSVRDAQGPQDLPINRTAAAAGADQTAQDPDFRLELVNGDRTMTLDRAQLARLRQRTHELPIACVEGWSRSASWTGVSVRDLIALVGGDPRSSVLIRSMQTRGAFGSSLLPAAFVADHRTMLALELNGETLTLDHGYPCRIIAPNRPGVFQTKWVRRIEVRG